MINCLNQNLFLTAAQGKLFIINVSIKKVNLLTTPPYAT